MALAIFGVSSGYRNIDRMAVWRHIRPDNYSDFDMTKPIFLHALRMIFFNPIATVRLAFAPWLVLVGLFQVIAMILPENDGPVTATPGFLTFFVIVTVFLTFIWVIVGWHRYVLLGETSRLIGPAWHGAEMWNYVLRMIWIAVVLLGPALIFVVFAKSFIYHFLLGISLSAINYIVLYQAAMSFVFGYLLLRFSLILPAAAVGKQMSISASWTATKSIQKTLWLLALIIVLIDLLSVGLTSILPDNLLSDIINVVLDCFVLLLNLSILTTLYGTLVEGRDVTT